MKANRLLGAALAVGLGLAAITGTTVAEAQKKQAAPAQKTAEPPTTKKTILLFPSGVAWGMSTKQVAAIIDKTLDAEYQPIYQKTSPGVKMKALDAQLAEDKSAFRRSRIDFGSIPTGVDSSPLKGEYTYNNKESLMTLDRNGKKTHFFFIQDRLWKIIDERALGEGSKHGKDYQEVVTKIAGTFGVPGRVQEADWDKGRMSTEVDWKDSATHLRIIQRSDTAVAVALEDNATLGNLATLRANKPAEDSGIDPSVASVTRKAEPEAPPPDAKDDKKKDNKKKK
jgi:hypothetical protein